MTQSAGPPDGSSVPLLRMANFRVVSCHRDTGDLIVHYLKSAGHQAHRLTSGAAVMDYLRSHPIDLVVLDLMLPGLSGMTVCELMRNDTATSHLPVIMLTARGDESDRLAGFERGADDYVTKPFSPKELVARVAARLRRSPAPDDKNTVSRYETITIDRGRHRVLVDGEEIKL